MSKKKITRKAAIILILLVIASFSIPLLILYITGNLSFGGPETPAPTTLTTIKLVASNSNPDGPNPSDDVSPVIPVDIYFVDPDSDFDSSDKEHLRPDAITDYFKLEVNGDYASNVEIDIANEPYLYIIIDPDDVTPFSKNYFLYLGGYNGEIIISVHHLSSNVFFENNLRTDGTRGVPTVTGNYTATITGFPKHASTWSDKHVGDRWDLTTTAFNALSASKQEAYLDEEYWCVQAPLYNPENDTDKDHDDELELWTFVPAFKLKMNETIGADASGTDVNITISGNSNIEILINGTYVYITLLEVVIPTYEVHYDLQLGIDIECSNMYFGNLLVPDDDISSINYYAYAYSL